MFFLLSLLAIPAHAENGCDNYCVAVRGNGEAEPAHPAALARMVEDFGMPKALAGGSSATVTQFLVEQVKVNAKASGADGERKRKLQALVLKSMPEFEAAMTKDAKIADGFGMLKTFSGGDTEQIKAAIAAFSNAGGMSGDELKAALAKYGSLLNPELVRLVQKDPEKFGPEAVQSVVKLGNFDAVGDKTLFFRPGLVDFKGVAVVLGYMADFYAGNTDDATKAKLDKFLDDCADATYHKEWMDAPEECRTRFQTIAADYLREGNFQNKALFDKVGAHGESMPTTAVLQGQGILDYEKKKQEYLNGTAQDIEKFSVNFDRDIRFGYWGDRDQLSAVQRGLAPAAKQGDVKAGHFRSLGAANWFEVLSTSPAEPGIANAQPIPFNTTWEQVKAELAKPLEERWKGLRYRKDVLSIGGWSDLHPVSVLRATPGCDRVVYLTRQAAYGDSKFGQQVFVRLTGMTDKVPFWKQFGDSNPGGWCEDQITAAHGDPREVRKAPWNDVSNLCNAKSSFRRALDAADAVYCTNWDADANEVFHGNMRALVKDAYVSPMIPTSDAGVACKLNAQPAGLDPKALPGCLPLAKPLPKAAAAPVDGEGTTGGTPAP